ASVIATDAAISIAIGIVKVAVFGVAGVVGAKVVAVAALIGLAAFPGAFLAKRLVDKLPLRAHVTILDTVVAIGGAMLILGAVMR
ncbi:MAG: sulfite exporter TauE/SafE family protein, partial [Xanthobacteraceae bacterium]